MNTPHCEHCENEAAVAKAAASGLLTEALREHANRCEVCAEVLLVSRYLQQESGAAMLEAEVDSPLPDGGRIWWKAQLAARREAVERAGKPIAIVERVSLALGAVTAAAFLLWAWPQVQGWSNLLRFAWLQSESFGLSAQPLYLLAAGGAMLVALVSLGAYAVWAEE